MMTDDGRREPQVFFCTDHTAFTSGQRTLLVEWRAGDISREGLAEAQRGTAMCRTPVRLVIADDQPVVLHGLISVVGSDRSFTIVASCSNGTESISIIRTLRPDVALLDMSMPGLNGLEILAIVRAEDLPTRIVFLTESIQDHDLTSAAVRGVHGIVFKDCSPDALLHGLREVASGRKWLPTALIDGAVQSETEGEDRFAAFGALTDREREVMRLAAEGLSNKQIARHLNVCDGTIKVHLQNVYRKVAVRNRTALAALAISNRGELSGLSVYGPRQPPAPVIGIPQLASGSTGLQNLAAFRDGEAACVEGVADDAG
jgi:DNA-binding NarL/FixJ family response regulator